MSSEHRRGAEYSPLEQMLAFAEGTGIVSMDAASNVRVVDGEGTELFGTNGHTAFGAGTPNRSRHHLSMLTAENGVLPQWTHVDPQTVGVSTAETLAFIPLQRTEQRTENVIERPATQEQYRVPHPLLGRLGLKRTVILERPAEVSQRTFRETGPRMMVNPYTQTEERAVSVFYKLSGISSDQGRPGGWLSASATVPESVAKDFYADVCMNPELARSFADSVLLQQCNYQDIDSARQIPLGSMAARQFGQPLTIVQSPSDYSNTYDLTVVPSL